MDQAREKGVPGECNHKKRESVDRGTTKLRASWRAKLACAGRAAALVGVAALGGGPWCGAGAAPAPEARNLTIVTYAADGFSQMSTLKVGRVFTENRRMGFFRVRLLPVLVAQDVHVELSPAAAGENWPASLQANFKPLFRRSSGGSSSEWRDLSVWLRGDAAPRLQAQRICPPTSGEAESLTLEGVTLQTTQGPVKRPWVRLELKKAPGQVVWEAEGAMYQWQVFTGQLISEPTKTKQTNKSL